MAPQRRPAAGAADDAAAAPPSLPSSKNAKADVTGLRLPATPQSWSLGGTLAAPPAAGDGKVGGAATNGDGRTTDAGGASSDGTGIKTAEHAVTHGAPAAVALATKTGGGEPQKKCNMCGNMISIGNFVPRTARCTCCNQLQSRVLRVLEGKQEYMLDWQELTADAKQDFYNKCKDSYGTDLAAELEFVVEERVQEKVMKTFSGNGVWVDEADLDAKYKDKPQQLAAIKDNAKSFFDSIRQVKLFEDLEYRSAATSVQEYFKEQKRKWEATQDIKVSKPKKVKVEKPAELTEDDKPISPSAIKLMQKLETRVAELAVKAMSLKTEIENDVKIKELVPSYVMQRANITSLQVGEKLAACTILREAGRGASHAKRLVDELKELKEKFENNIKSLEYQKGEAEEALGL
jgi:hypothetical protein